MNSVHCSGNIEGDSKLVGEGCLTFHLSVEKRTKDGDNWKSTYIKIPVAVMGKRASKLQEYTKDGGRVVVEGELALTGEGKVYLHAQDVVLAGRKKDGVSAGSGANPSF